MCYGVQRDWIAQYCAVIQEKKELVVERIGNVSVHVIYTYTTFVELSVRGGSFPLNSLSL